MLLQAAAQAPPADGLELVGHEYSCTAKVEIGSEPLQGALVVTEEGKPDRFSAQYYGVRDEIGDLFFAENWRELKRRSIDHHVRLSLVWDIRDLTIKRGGTLPTFTAGQFRMNVSTRERLPEQVFLLLAKGEHESTGLMDYAYRWQGRQTSAEFSIPLEDLFGFKGKVSRLKWRLMEPPLPVDWFYSSRQVRAQGWVEPDSVRTLQAPFAELMRQLRARGADYRRQCERVPIYYDPLSDISVTR
jgi:hypothetical protein